MKDADSETLTLLSYVLTGNMMVDRRPKANIYSRLLDGLCRGESMWGIPA